MADCDESKTKETSPFYDPFIKINLETAFAELQDAVYKSKDVKKTLQLLEHKAVPFGFMTCANDQTAALVVKALQQKDFGVLSGSYFDLSELIFGVCDVSGTLKKINNDEAAVIGDLVTHRAMGATVSSLLNS